MRIIIPLLLYLFSTSIRCNRDTRLSQKANYTVKRSKDNCRTGWLIAHSNVQLDTRVPCAHNCLRKTPSLPKWAECHKCSPLQSYIHVVNVYHTYLGNISCPPTPSPSPFCSTSIVIFHIYN